MNAKPIQTKYNGFLFRSRLEARWAVFFDYYQEVFEYEKEGYELKSGWYLPDFWLPRLECWFEVKPTYPTELEKRLCEQLADETNKPVVITKYNPFSSIQLHGAIDVEAFCGDTNDSGGGSGWWDALIQTEISGQLIFVIEKHSLRSFCLPWLNEVWAGVTHISEPSRPMLLPISSRSIDASKSARF